MSKNRFVNIDSLSLDDFNDEAELIPLLTPEDEEAMNKEALPDALPILSLRNTVLFPGVVIPITAGRDKSIKLLNTANKGSKVVGVVAQKDESVEDPTAADIHQQGTVARILRVLKMPDGNITVIIQGKKRFQIKEVVQEDPYMQATIQEVAESRPEKGDSEFLAIIESIKDLALDIIKDSTNSPARLPLPLKILRAVRF